MHDVQPQSQTNLATAKTTNKVGPSNTAARIEHLDMLRGVAAMLVFLGHLRGFTFVNLGAAGRPDLMIKAFYAVTSLGHEAVIVFFALSGYLVGGKALADMLSDRWRWDRYLLRRLTRLYIVLIPALALTLMLDHIGMAFGGRDILGSTIPYIFRDQKQTIIR